MGTVTLQNPYYFQSGTGGVSAVIGNDAPGSGHRRIARYEFTAPAAGASHLSFDLFYTYLLGKSADKPLYFYVGTSPTSHAAAGEGYDYTGVVTVTATNSSLNEYRFTGAAGVLLAPNTKYYLWIFPSSDTGWCYYGADTATARTVEVTGGAGLVYMGNRACQVYIDSGGDLGLYIPFLDNGSGWDLCT